MPKPTNSGATPKARKKTAWPTGPAGIVAAEARELAILKLQSSGLDEADMKILRMEALGPLQTQAHYSSFDPLPSIKITYWDPTDLNKPLAAHPKWPPFYRIRYLRSAGDKKDDVRYTNEPGAGVVAYFPPNVDWPLMVPDATKEIIITEGELKAAKVGKCGYACIGLGGVWNFKSAPMGHMFLPELEQFNWVKRRVHIIFDSDVQEKQGVMEALNALADALKDRGALVYTVILPEAADGKKQGIDDYLVANPLVNMENLLCQGQPITEAAKLHAMNDELIYIADPGMIVRRKTNQKLSPGAMKEHAYSNSNYAEQHFNDEGKVSLRAAPIAHAWLKWPLRAGVNGMTYKPGAPKILNQDDKFKSAWNIWPGWGVQPEHGDVQPFLDLVAHLFKGSDPKDMEWFLKWCAYPLQYPSTKLFTACVIHGVKHGTGKSLVGYTLGRIYGSNFTEINQTHLHAGFNSWAEGKQLVMGDDVTGSNKRQDNDLLKKLITQRELRVNAKFMPEYVVPDCVNYLFTSNHPDAFFLENDDRRFFIHEVLTTPLHEDFYMEYSLWLDTTGPSALFAYLLGIDLSDFNPSAPALRTAAKEQMTSDTRSDLGDWVNKLRLEPDHILKVGNVVVPGDLFTTGDLLGIYDPNEMKRITANGLGRELRRAAFPRANRGLPIRGAGGTDRYFIIRNVEKWIDATPAQLHEQLVKQAGGDKTRGKKY